MHDIHPVSALQSPRQNHLLRALPHEEFARLAPHLELIALPLGKVVYESSETQTHILFPTNSIVSLLYVMESGATAEVAVVGFEGVVGVSVLMGGVNTIGRAVVQSAGEAYQIKSQLLVAEFARGGALQLLILRYTQALLTQMSQTAICNRYHSIEQQLRRWLLLSLDRLSGNKLQMTHELIANMLGVRREGVSEAAGKLHALGLIDYAHGKITVVDRAKLEAGACECYAAVKREYERLLPDIVL
jgi:CRP-like cAMP-binding protein